MIEQIHKALLIRVSVPTKDFWMFLEQFSQEFARQGGDDLGREFKAIRSVESYSVDWRIPERMLASVLLLVDEEEKFQRFCERFSASKEVLEETQKLSDSIAKGEETPTCQSCGFVLVYNGAVYRCLNCGETAP